MIHPDLLFVALIDLPHILVFKAISILHIVMRLLRCLEKVDKVYPKLLSIHDKTKYIKLNSKQSQMCENNNDN